jgi:putative tricarboxylic transport membrane protein
MIFGLVAAVALASGSLWRAIAMVVLGLLLGLVGTDVNSGAQRMTLGLPQLADGIGFVPLAMGVFGIAEILKNLETRRGPPFVAKVGSLMPTLAELRGATPAIFRGTALGAVLGVLPGAGALLASFGSYALEKRIARDPTKFGRGAIQGVAGPESANNAAAQTAFVPLLTLGIPPTPSWRSWSER